MIEETNLPDAYPDIEATDAASQQGVLYLNQDEHGGVELSPRAQYDLLEFLYARRYALYQATHLSLGANDTPEWIKSGSATATRIIDTQPTAAPKTTPRPSEGSIVYLADGREIRAEVERFYDQGRIQFESRTITVERLPRPYDGRGYGELVIIKRPGKTPLGAVLHPHEYVNHIANVPVADIETEQARRRYPGDVITQSQSGSIMAMYDQTTKEWREMTDEEIQSLRK
jgi:hypothetical protein